MNNPAFTHLCPGCFAEKGNASTCPHCGYDESQKRGPLVLPHRTLLNNGQYLIGKVLGKPGGFGITYLAFDTKLETKVAIKEYLPRDLAGRDGDHATISAHSADDAEHFRYGLTQFLQEARTLARFDHANIVRVRNFFEENGTGYLVMDYYDGITLADYLAQQPQGKLPEKTAVDILMPILDGLREVHAQNFLHRDIKPQNIYLTTGNRAILLDFGAARQAMSERSRSLSVVLSEGYAPYEQYHRRGEQGPWTDIYACAAVLCHMVAGEPPPPATERMAKDDLDIRMLGVTTSLAKALRLGLAVDHKNRPQTMTEFQGLLMGCIVSISSVVQTPEDTHTDLPAVTEGSEALQFFEDHRFMVEMPTSPTLSESIKLNARGEIVAFIPEALAKIKSTTGEKWYWSVLVIIFVIIWAATDKNATIPIPSETARTQQQQVEQDAWNNAKTQNNAESYAAYLSRYPQGSYALLAQLSQTKLQSEAAKLKEQTDERERQARGAEQSAWRDAKRVNTVFAYRQYLSQYPQGLNSSQATVAINQAEIQQWNEAQSATDSATVQAFLNRYPSGRHTIEAQALLADLKKKEAEPYSTVGSYPITDCVKSKSTGLTWEGKPLSGERASNKEYTNYGDRRSGDASAYVDSVNAMRLCGYSDWRLPAKDELKALVVSGFTPSIDGIWFPNTKATKYWSASRYVGDEKFAWYVVFMVGYVDYDICSYPFHVRLVR